MSEQMAVKPEVAALLRRVKRRILAQPKRFNMLFWGHRTDEGDPACGTVACIAGWIALDSMTIPEVRRMPDRRFASLMERAWKIAEKAVGVPANREDDGSFSGHPLFVTEDWPRRFRERYREAAHAADAVGKASVAAERIEHFIHTGE